MSVIVTSIARALGRNGISINIFERWGELRAGEEIIEGNIEKFRHLDEDINVGSTAALFVHPNGARTKVECLG